MSEHLLVKLEFDHENTRNALYEIFKDYDYQEADEIKAKRIESFIALGCTSNATFKNNLETKQTLSSYGYIDIDTFFSIDDADSMCIDHLEKKGKNKLEFGLEGSCGLDAFFDMVILNCLAIGAKVISATLENTQVGGEFVLKFEDAQLAWEEFEASLEGEFVVITGKFEDYTRLELEEIVEDLDGNVQKTVNGKTTILVTGAKTGKSKLDKAKDLGIQTINEEAFLALIGY